MIGQFIWIESSTSNRTTKCFNTPPFQKTKGKNKTKQNETKTNKKERAYRAHDLTAVRASVHTIR